jgi:hypothetical protein
MRFVHSGYACTWWVRPGWPCSLPCGQRQGPVEFLAGNLLVRTAPAATAMWAAMSSDRPKWAHQHPRWPHYRQCRRRRPHLRRPLQRPPGSLPPLSPSLTPTPPTPPVSPTGLEEILGEVGRADGGDGDRAIRALAAMEATRSGQGEGVAAVLAGEHGHGGGESVRRGEEEEGRRRGSGAARTRHGRQGTKGILRI